jgi:hypothetical protein
MLTRTTMAGTEDFLTGLTNKGLIQAHPADATKFQVKLGLRVAYPASPKGPNIVAGKTRIPVVLLNHGQHDNWGVSRGWVPAGSAVSSSLRLRGRIADGGLPERQGQEAT